MTSSSGRRGGGGGGGGDQQSAAMAALSQRANQAAQAAAAIATPVARRIAEAVADASGGGGDRRGGGGRSGGGKGDGHPTGFAFLDSMCGPVLQRFGVDGSGDDDRDGGGGRRRGRRGRSNPRRLVGSYDQDDETYVTDATGSYEDDDDDGTYGTYESRGGRGGRRGRDRRPREGVMSPRHSQVDSPSEMTGGYSEFDDETTQNDTVTEASTSYTPGGNALASVADVTAGGSSTGNGSGKLIAQPLASGFAKRCYFTKAGIGRSTQHYEGLTLTGNTVLMLAGAMRLKGCPTICDEDLRRVEGTYPNQFSRLPDELLLSSGWRRISKYCHFSGRPVPDGVPFFHSRRRCHPGGGYYFLLCGAVGMTRLMDVEPLGRDALAVLQTDFPTSCERCPEFLMGDPGEWTLVNKFCFFSGGPINTDEDVFYRAELGGSEIYMLAFLSPSLSPEELYRLRPPADGADAGGARGQQPPPPGGPPGPLATVAAVGEVESVYDLTERDFDDLKLYHLGPCRALPPFLLHPEAWTKVLPPHFVAARTEALRRAYELEGRSPEDAAAAAAQGADGAPRESSYVELGGQVPPAPGPGAPPPVGGGQGSYPADEAGYPPPYPQQPAMSGQDPHGGSPYGYPPPVGPGGYPQQHPAQQMGEADYYYDGAGQGSVSAPPPGQGYPPPPGRMAPPQYDSPSRGPHGPGPYHPQQQLYGSPSHPYHGPSPPQYHGGGLGGQQHWQRDVHEEGAFGGGARGGPPRVGQGPADSPHDEAMYGTGGPYPPDPGYGAGYPQGEDPPVDPSVSSAGPPEVPRDRPRRPSPARRPDLSSKLEGRGGHGHRGGLPPAPSPGDESTLDDTRTDAESSYGTSLVSGTSSYTDTTPGERNSRRALILQMAKARMKSGRTAAGGTGGAGTDPAGPPGARDGARDLEGMVGLELD